MLTVACVSFRPHQTFLHNMNYHVGKNADDPEFKVNRYPQKVGVIVILPNGNKEVELIIKVSPPYKERCSIYYEIDKDTNIVIGARWEGTEESCVVRS